MRVDAAVDDKLVQGQAGDFAADRIERGQQDGIRGVVHDDLNAGRGLEGADVAALTADDAALDLVTFDREGRDGILNGRFTGCPLDRGDDDAFGLLGGIEPGLVHGIVDVGLRFRTGFGLHVLDELVLGFLGGHAGDGFDLFVDLCLEAVIFLGFALGILPLRLEAVLHVVGIFEPLVQFAVLLVQGVLLLFQAVLGIADGSVLFGDILLMLAFELEELLLGLEDLFFLDVFSFQFRFFQDFILAALENDPPDPYIDCEGQQGTDHYADQQGYECVHKSILV